MQDLIRVLPVSLLLKQRRYATCHNLAVTLDRLILAVNHVVVIQQLTKRLIHKLIDVEHSRLYGLDRVGLEHRRSPECPVRARPLCRAVQRRRDIRYPVGEIHKVNQRVLERRHVVRQRIILERRSSVAQLRVGEIHRAGDNPADVLVRHVLGHTGVVRLSDRRRAVVRVGDEIAQAGLIAALHITQALGNRLPRYPVLSRIEAGGKHRAPVERRVLLHQHLNDVPSAHRNHGVVKLIVLKPRHAVLRKLTPAEVAPVDKDINGGVVVTPRENLTVRLLRIVGNPVVAEVVAVGVIENLDNVLADVRGHLGCVKQLLACPALAYENTRAALGVGAVRTPPEIPRRDGLELVERLVLGSQGLARPLHAHTAGRYGASQHSIGVHTEIIDEAEHGSVPPALGTLVGDKLHHVVSDVLSVLQLLACRLRLEAVHQRAEVSAETLLHGLLDRLGDHQLAGVRQVGHRSRLDSPRQLPCLYQGLGKITLHHTCLHRRQVDMGVNADVVYNLLLSRGQYAVILVVALAQDHAQGHSAHTLLTLPAHGVVEAPCHYGSELVPRVIGNLNLAGVVVNFVRVILWHNVLTSMCAYRCACAEWNAPACCRPASAPSHGRCTERHTAWRPPRGSRYSSPGEGRTPPQSCR